MAARSPRRTFAHPFVITLATLPACSSPPKPVDTTVVMNPPRPVAEIDGTPEPTSGDHPPTAMPDPAPIDSRPSPPMKNPPPKQPPSPAPATYDQRWTVMKAKTGECNAYVEVNCPKAEPGKPMATCNPPPPIKYTCPGDLAENQTVKITLRAGATDCFAELGSSCPPYDPKHPVMCNPPPPRKVECPKR